MKSASKLGIILVAVTSFVFSMAGCSVTYRARIYSIPPDLEVEFQGWGEAVSIKNQAKEGIVPIESTLPLISPEQYVSGEQGLTRYFTDLKQVTDVSASLLAEELSKKGFSVQRDVSKSITLNVTGIYLLYISTAWQCFIELKYTTSDGHSQTVLGGQVSDYYPSSACDGAIMRAVVELFLDEELRDFLRKGD